MTTEEFKKDYPKYASLEGNELWDTMAQVILRHQQADAILAPLLPFYKRYRLRWLFYRKRPNTIFTKEWQSETVCKNCGRGANSFITFSSNFLTGEPNSRFAICLGCGNKLTSVPNRRLKYLLWLAYKPIEQLFWLLLDKIHLIRSSHSGRYEIFGDESHYVQCYTYDMEWRPTGYRLKPRPWYEYIFITKR